MQIIKGVGPSGKIKGLFNGGMRTRSLSATKPIFKAAA
jgi:hypothetical protein